MFIFTFDKLKLRIHAKMRNLQEGREKDREMGMYFNDNTTRRIK